MVEAAEGGDEEAVEELRAEHVEAIEAMIEALDDPESRKLIELGMMLALSFGSIRRCSGMDRKFFDGRVQISSGPKSCGKK
mgnify:CR=1 FL=1